MTTKKPVPPKLKPVNLSAIAKLTEGAAMWHAQAVLLLERSHDPSAALAELGKALDAIAAEVSGPQTMRTPITDGAA